MNKWLLLVGVLALFSLNVPADAQRGRLSQTRTIEYKPVNSNSAVVPIAFEHMKHYRGVALTTKEQFLDADLMGQFNIPVADLQNLPFALKMEDPLPAAPTRMSPALELEVVSPSGTIIFKSIERQTGHNPNTYNFVFQSKAQKFAAQVEETAPLTVDVLNDETLTLQFIHIPTGERLEIYSGAFARVE